VAVLAAFGTLPGTTREVSTIQVPGLGSVSIHSVRTVGTTPFVSFLNQQGAEIFRVTPETGKFWVVQDIDDATGPHIYYEIFHASGLPSPLVLVVDHYVYADDCGYSPVIVGLTGGRLQAIAPKLPEFATRGGAYLSVPTGNTQAQLTVVAERYQIHDIHVNGPSKMAVYVYDFDKKLGQFRLVRQQELPTDKVRVSGKSILSIIPEFASC
ncbi:MAG: hypothetical protein WA426_06545, partial [Silvibacterium sp.]